MPSVTLCLYGYSGDIERLYRNAESIIKAHEYPFHEILIIHQDCSSPNLDIIEELSNSRLVYTSAYPDIWKNFNIDLKDEKYLKVYDGNNQHWWYPNHLINQLIGLQEAVSDYIVFNDSDCVIVRNDAGSWVSQAEAHLRAEPDVLVVSPSDGAPGRTQIMSQQMWMCERERVKNIDWNCWDGNYIEGGPFKSYYPMAEGRIGMYMHYNNLYRLVLPDTWRFYHDPWAHKVPEDLWKIANERLKV